MNKSNQWVTGIAEISLRVHDLDVMRKFYEEVIGLEVMREFDDTSGKCVFYAIGNGNNRDGQNMALFQETYQGWIERNRSPQIEVKQSTLHHLAFSIPPEEFESEKRRLEQFGIEILRSGTGTWMQARMFYFADPEGNAGRSLKNSGKSKIPVEPSRNAAKQDVSARYSEAIGST